MSGFSDSERAVLRVLDEADGESLKTCEVMRRADLPRRRGATMVLRVQSIAARLESKGIVEHTEYGWRIAYPRAIPGPE